MAMKEKPLSCLAPGQAGRVLEVNCPKALSTRLEDLGLLPGMEITCLHRSPAGTPAAYDIRGATIALRREDAAKIWVEARP
jgi:ferrous iron transport protein A